MRFTRRWLFGLLGGAAATPPGVPFRLPLGTAPAPVPPTQPGFFFSFVDTAGKEVARAAARRTGPTRLGLTDPVAIPGETLLTGFRLVRATEGGDALVYDYHQPYRFTSEGTMSGVEFSLDAGGGVSPAAGKAMFDALLAAPEEAFEPVLALAAEPVRYEDEEYDEWA